MIRLRQVVLVATDLRGAVADLRQALGVNEGIVHDMSHLRLEHEILTVGDTFLEIVSPLDPEGDDPAARALRRAGDGGYMVVLQVTDLDTTLEQATSAGVRVVHAGELHGARFAQYHPKDAATLLETDQVDPWESWHFAPEIFERASLDVSLGIVGATVAANDPEQAARTWSAIGGLPAPDSNVLELDQGTITFVQADDRTGLVALDVSAADRSRVGVVIECRGVKIRFVEAPTIES